MRESTTATTTNKETESDEKKNFVKGRVEKHCMNDDFSSYMLMHI